LQYLAFCCLRIAKVHHLVHQLVYDHKVVPDGLFFELFKVFNQNLGKAVKKQDDFDCIGISF
jgi:hypothetical protein